MPIESIDTSSVEIPQEDFAAMLEAVRGEFGGLPDSDEARMFVGQWVVDNYPAETEAIVAVAFMRRYSRHVGSR